MQTTKPPVPTKYSSFAEFYPFYLSEHSHRSCRRLHFVGTSLSLGFAINAVIGANPWWWLAALLVGYGFAWVGHFGFEKNRPASFKQPVYSFLGDWKMWWQILSGKIAF